MTGCVTWFLIENCNIVAAEARNISFAIVVQIIPSTTYGEGKVG